MSPRRTGTLVRDRLIQAAFTSLDPKALGCSGSAPPPSGSSPKDIRIHILGDLGPSLALPHREGGHFAPSPETGCGDCVELGQFSLHCLYKHICESSSSQPAGRKRGHNCQEIQTSNTLPLPILPKTGNSIVILLFLPSSCLQSSGTNPMGYPKGLLGIFKLIKDLLLFGASQGAKALGLQHRLC